MEEDLRAKIEEQARAIEQLARDNAAAEERWQAAEERRQKLLDDLLEKASPLAVRDSAQSESGAAGGGGAVDTAGGEAVSRSSGGGPVDEASDAVSRSSGSSRVPVGEGDQARRGESAVLRKLILWIDLAGELSPQRHEADPHALVCEGEGDRRGGRGKGGKGRGGKRFGGAKGKESITSGTGKDLDSVTCWQCRMNEHYQNDCTVEILCERCGGRGHDASK